MLLIVILYSITITIFYIKEIYFKNYNNIDKLKNAILSYALLKICKDDINEIDTNYNNFDGSMLPMLDNNNNIIYSYYYYIINNNNSKQRAINKYIEINFNTEKQIINFFKKYINL